MPVTTSHYLLYIPQIAGPVTQAGISNAIQINSFSWGIHNAPNIGVGVGQASGMAQMSEMSFTAPASIASTNLFFFCAQGTALTQAPVLSLLTSGTGGAPKCFMQFTMTNAFISSYNVSGSGLGEIANPDDSFTIAFQQLQIQYAAQSATGTWGSLSGTHSYDITTQVAS
jgi:type VI secretion system secreted protein Hcp